MHTVLKVAPTALDHEPPAHGVHALAPEALYVPASHTVIEPEPGHAEPAGQAVQFVSRDAPTVLVHVPAAQGVQEDARAADHVPTGHSVVPLTSQKEPAGHRMLHWRESVEPGSEDVPGAHAEQF